MKYKPNERWEVIRQAYIGLFELASMQLFEKYIDFIDIYAEVAEEERDMILHEMRDRKDTVMIRQVLMEEGRRVGRQEGHLSLLNRLLIKKYRRSSDDLILKGLQTKDLLELGEFMLDCDSFSDIEKWIQQRKLSNMS